MAQRFLRLADVAAVQDEPVVGVEQKFFGHDAHQFIFYFAHVFAGGEVHAVADAKDVGVDGHHGLAEGGVEDDVGGFAADAGQRFEFFARLRHLASVFFQKDAAGFDDVFGLGFVKADGLRVFHHAFQPQIKHGLRRGRGGKQAGGGLVDAFVGGLRRQQHGNQELEGRAVLQLGLRMRIGRAPAGENFLAGLLVHGFRRPLAGGKGRLKGRFAFQTACFVLLPLARLAAELPGRKRAACLPQTGAACAGGGFGGRIGGEIRLGLLPFGDGNIVPGRAAFDLAAVDVEAV